MKAIICKAKQTKNLSSHLELWTMCTQIKDSFMEKMQLW